MQSKASSLAVSLIHHVAVDQALPPGRDAAVAPYVQAQPLFENLILRPPENSSARKLTKA